MTDLNEPTHTLFQVPVWQKSVIFHDKVKDIYMKQIDKMENNFPNQADLGNVNSFKTLTNLHIDPVFKEITENLIVLGNELKKTFDIVPSKNIGLSSMYATKSYEKGVVKKHYAPNSLLYGIYFLKTPADSGRFEIDMDVGDRTYFSNVLYDSPNPYNTNHTTVSMPEGEIFILPSYLEFGISPNFSKENTRYLIHFTFSII